MAKGESSGKRVRIPTSQQCLKSCLYGIIFDLEWPRFAPFT